MSPNLLARIQPSPEDRIPEYLRCAILDEVKAMFTLAARSQSNAEKRAAFKEANGRPSVITPMLIANIRSLSAKGYGPHSIAKQLKVSRATIYKAAEVHGIALCDSRRGGAPKVPQSKRHGSSEPAVRSHTPAYRAIDTSAPPSHIEGAA